MSNSVVRTHQPMPRNREMVGTKLQRITEKACKDPGCKFTSLFHLMNVEMLRGCFGQLRKDAASGINKVTKEEYRENLEDNLTALVEKLHRMSYVPLCPCAECTFPNQGVVKSGP